MFDRRAPWGQRCAATEKGKEYPSGNPVDRVGQKGLPASTGGAKGAEEKKCKMGVASKKERAKRET